MSAVDDNNGPVIDTTQLYFAAGGNEPDIIQDFVLPGESMNQNDYTFGNGNSANVQLNGNAEVDDNDVFTYPSKMVPDLSKHTKMTNFMKDVYDIINYHSQWIEPKYKILYDYYKGRHYSIINKNGETSKPDTRLIINYPKQLTDSFCGYDNGNAVQITQSSGGDTDDKNNQQINNYLTMQSFWSASMDLNKMSSIYGRSYLYAYYDGINIDFLPCSPMDTIVVYDDTVMQRPLFAIRYSTGDNGEFSGVIITKKGEYHFSPNQTRHGVMPSGETKSVTDKSLISIDHSHPDTRLFSDNIKNIHNELPVLPIIELPENKGRIGIFADCIGLIDNADLVLSQKANDLKALQNEYLVITGVKLTKDQIKQIRKSYLINLYQSNRQQFNPNGDKDKPSAGFLAPKIDDGMQEHQLQHLTDQIYKTAHVVNLDNANNSSGANTATAIRKQYQDMKSKAEIKDANYNRVLRTFFTLMYTFWGFDMSLLGSLQFHHQLDEPINVLEECQAYAQVYGKVPEALALSILSNVANPQQMANQMNNDKQQQQSSVQSMVTKIVNQQMNKQNADQNQNNPMTDTNNSKNQNGDNNGD